MILSGANAGRARTPELASRHHIGSGAEIGERLDHGLVGIRLHRVADERLHVGEGVREYLVMPFERRGRVAIERGADRLRKIDEVDRFGVQHAVAVGEMVHGSSRADSIDEPVDGSALSAGVARAPGRQRPTPGPGAGPAAIGGSKADAPGRRIEPALASAAGKTERGDERSNGGNPAKRQVGEETQFRHS